MNFPKKKFHYLTSLQRTEIRSCVARYVKKFPELKNKEIVDLFLEDERFMLERNMSRYEWLNDFFDDKVFLRDLETEAYEQQMKAKIKEEQKPLVLAQKEYQKKLRKKAQDAKMANESPSKKQISYCRALYKRHGFMCDESTLKDLSRLDLRNMISLLCDEQFRDDKEKLIIELKKFIKQD